MKYDTLFIEPNLPETLKEEELIELLKEVKYGNCEAKDKIITHNIRLIIMTIKTKFANALYYHEGKDLVSVGTIGLIKAVNTFDITKGFKFSTYAARCVDNEILMYIHKEDNYINKEKIIGTNDYIMQLMNKVIDVEEHHKNKELLLAVRSQVEQLDDKERKIIKLFFGFYDDKEYSQAQISQMLEIPKHQVSRIIHRVLNQIEQNMLEEGLIEEPGKRKKLRITKITK